MDSAVAPRAHASPTAHPRKLAPIKSSKIAPMEECECASLTTRSQSPPTQHIPRLHNIQAAVGASASADSAANSEVVDSAANSAEETQPRTQGSTPRSVGSFRRRSAPRAGDASSSATQQNDSFTRRSSSARRGGLFSFGGRFVGRVRARVKKTKQVLDSAWQSALRQKDIQRYQKRVATFHWHRKLLFVLLTSYVLIGGAIFMAIEQVRAANRPHRR